MIYGWILVAVVMNADGTLEGQGLDYFDEYEACSVALDIVQNDAIIQ